MQKNRAWSLLVLEALLRLGVLGGVLGVVTGIVQMAKSDITATVTLTHHSPGVGKPFTDLVTATGATLQPETGTLTLTDPTLVERLAAGLPTLVAALTVLVVTGLLLRAVRRVRAGEAFAEGTVGVVVRAAQAAAIGAALYVPVSIVAQGELSGAAPASLGVATAFSVDFSPVLAVALLFGFAEVLRQGLAVSRELEGVV